MMVCLSSNVLAMALFAAAPDSPAGAVQRLPSHPAPARISSQLMKLRDTAVPEISLNNPSPDSAGGAMRPAGVTQTQFEQDVDPRPLESEIDTLSHDGLPGRHAADAIPIGPSIKTPRPASTPPEPPSAAGSLTTIISSLAIVLGLFLCVAWVSRRGWARRKHLLSKDVVEIMGRAPLTSRQHLHLIKFANKLLLVAVTPDSAKTLTEITDPDEIVRVRSLCEQAQPGSNISSFQEVFSTLNPVDVK